jgi:hypothetical protein
MGHALDRGEGVFGRVEEEPDGRWVVVAAARAALGLPAGRSGGGSHQSIRLLVLLREDSLEGALPKALKERPVVVAPTIVGAAAPPAAVSLAADGRPRVHNLWWKTADLKNTG